MAGLGNDIGVLFKIKADSSDATRDIARVKNEVQGLGVAGAGAGTGLAALANPAAIAATAVAAVGTAAVAAAAAIFRLTVDASEYGSAILEASQKTGLSTEAISALKIAADQSGSSLEAVTAGIARFAKNYTGTSQDLQTELGKVFQQIADAKPGFEQLQLAQEKFGRSGANLIPIIQSFKGNLPDLIDQMKRLGLTMTQDAAEKADQFGDQLDTLKAQSAALGRQFATELMPLMTQAMAQISASMAANQGQAQKWGQVLVNAAKGVGVVYKAFEISVLASLNAVTLGFSSTSNVVVAKSAIMTTAIYALLGPLGMLAALGQMLGGATGGVSSGVDSTVNSILDQMQAAGGLNIPKVSGGGRGGGGGGGGGSAGRDTSVADAQDRDRKILEDFKASNEQLIAENDRKLAAMEISEQEHLNELYRLKLAELDFERNLLEQQLKLAKLTAKDREDIEHRIGIIRTNRRTEDIKNSKDVTEQELKDLNKVLEGMIEFDAWMDELHRREIKRHQERDAARSKQIQAAFDEDRRKFEEALIKKTIGSGGTANQIALLQEGLFKAFKGGDLSQTGLTAMTAGVDALSTAFQGLGQAVGQVVQAWVLYGSAGASVRQVTAQILAGVAQQAAVKAVFELAEGFAALAMAFFGIPNAGPSASAHFTAAAIYGSIAGVAAVAGRGVAGNSFNQTAGSAGSGGVGAGNGASQQNNFTTRFNGFGNAMGEQIRQQNQVIAALEETITRFDRKFNTASPGAVVMAGANEASRAIVGALHSEYSDNPASVDGTMRNLGFAR